jgi:transcriptional regulator
MSQNRPEADRRGVVAGFREAGEVGEEIADLIVARGRLFEIAAALH